MRRLNLLTRSSLLLLLCAVTSFADSWIVQLNPSAANGLMQQYGGFVQQILHSDGVYRIWLPSGPLGNLIANALKSNPAVKSVEPDSLVGLPTPGAVQSGHTLSTLSVCTGASSATPATMYLTQASNCVVNVAKAQGQFGGGAPSVTVAVIDTGVDFTHPVLAATKAGAQDFTGSGDIYGNVAQETSPMVDQETSPMVDQETSPMVDSAGTIVLNQETSPMVDQETSPMVDAYGNKLPPAFGHGTMVAGIIHLVAPNVKILSLKAFTNKGTATLSTIVAALYAAADRPDVEVINASWSTTANSKLLRDAISYANQKGKIVVASVANNGNGQQVYPAALDNVIGVGCTDNKDARCSFSNFGPDVSLAAPGFGITTTFPMAYSRTGYATGWGTSFSTPYVAGTVALIQSRSNPNAGQTEADLAKGADPLPKSLSLGAGRLDVWGSVAAAH